MHSFHAVRAEIEESSASCAIPWRLGRFSDWADTRRADRRTRGKR